VAEPLEALAAWNRKIERTLPRCGYGSLRFEINAIRLPSREAARSSVPAGTLAIRWGAPPAAETDIRLPWLA